VAATGQVAAAPICLASPPAGGSVFGCKPAPSIKLATNSPMFKRMKTTWTSIAGTILDGRGNGASSRQRIFDLMLKTRLGGADQDAKL